MKPCCTYCFIPFVINIFIIVKGNNLTLKGYFGEYSQRIYYITEKYSMTAGATENICESRDLKLYDRFKFYQQIIFIRDVLMRSSEWSTDDNLWVPYIRVDVHKPDWIRIQDCQQYGLAFKIVNNSYKQELPECSIINITANEKDKILWTTSCFSQNSFVCYEDNNEGSSKIRTYKKKILIPASNLQIKENTKIDLKKCKKKLVWRHIVVSVFTSVNGNTSCLTGELISLSEEGVFSLIDVDYESTVFYKEIEEEYRTKVVIDKRPKISIQNTSLPCHREYSSHVDANSTDPNNCSSQNQICYCSEQKIFNRIEQERYFSHIREQLLLDRKTLVSYKLLKVSAGDPRTSSAALGHLAVVVLVSIAFLIVMIDVSNALAARKPNNKTKKQ